MSAALFREKVTHYEQSVDKQSILIRTETGRELVFSDRPDQHPDLRLGNLNQVIGPGDAIPEEYTRVAPDITDPNVIVALWQADSSSDPPHDLVFFCGQIAKQNFHQLIRFEAKDEIIISHLTKEKP